MLTIILCICTVLAFIWLLVDDDNISIAGVIAIFLLIFSATSFYIDKEKTQKKTVEPKGWYYLKISDSPHIVNVHPELDYISNDTAYINWYSNNCK